MFKTSLLFVLCQSNIQHQLVENGLNRNNYLQDIGRYKKIILLLIY